MSPIQNLPYLFVFIKSPFFSTRLFKKLLRYPGLIGISSFHELCNITMFTSCVAFISTNLWCEAFALLCFCVWVFFLTML